MSIAWKRRIATGLTLLAIALPTTAWPYSLDQLLAIPLERLMRLHITHAAVAASAASTAQRGPHAS